MLELIAVLQHLAEGIGTAQSERALIEARCGEIVVPLPKLLGFHSTSCGASFGATSLVPQYGHAFHDESTTFWQLKHVGSG